MSTNPNTPTTDTTTTASSGRAGAGPAARQLNGLRIVLGVILLALGIAVLAWPGVTILIVALLFGIQLIVVGAIRVVLAAKYLVGGRRTLTTILGVLTAIAGVVCLIHPGTSLLLIIWSVAFGWASDGISELTSGLTKQRTPLQRVTMVVFGVSSIIGAILIITFPGASLLLFNQIGGVLLLVFGVITLASAVRSRRTTTA